MTDLHPAPSLWRDTIQSLRFYSRLPLPVLPGEDDPHRVPDFAVLARAVPMAGLVLGGLAGMILVPAALVLPALVAATLAVGCSIIMTGAFHEDGLADTADSFGGMTRDRRLDIMKDSRIGTFGGAALIIALMLKVTTLASLIPQVGIGGTALALAACGALSRTAALALAFYLPPARDDGAAYATGAPTPESWDQARFFALLTAPLLWPAGGVAGTVTAILVIVGVAFGMVALARRHVGGYVGDMAGATQQVSEIAVLMTLLILA
ncbi:adenosylcobinamide-GDP ribazoletransferase [Phreatobacter aquaticus]|uniref:Adenosylcobinamide-GDP ribazoletransferase n=1 Tax=Phreatobacter aquaticus TaxID=2570229 RepID=A0A4D7QI98_9HYPH|nr:adenosylcobinamide-GDP ribazoletransferase [Phreatobacter aquaticus]QCK86685.1 adenosylcobinamide-GDP ribazoletransferase [Phreatobacter aquaticus]